MEKHLGAVGFSGIGHNQWHNLFKDVWENPTERYILGRDNDDARFEYFKLYGDDFGVVMRGAISDSDENKISSCVPFAKSNVVLDAVYVNIDMDENNGMFYVVCEDEESGNELEFSLQNVIEYLDLIPDDEAVVAGVTVTGYSTSGTIIFPVSKEEYEREMEKEQDVMYKELIKRSRSGDSEADEMLELQADETAEIIRERLKNEDFLSVVEGYFFPDEDKRAAYLVLGDIFGVREKFNSYTNQKIYELDVQVMGIPLKIFVNDAHLVGQPMVGMRFMASCWLEGKVIFL